MSAISISGAKRFLRWALYYYTHPTRVRIKQHYFAARYAHNAFPKELVWNWGLTNYNRIALVNLLVAQRKDCAYLEIGCAKKNPLYDSVPVADKTGVDPEVGGNMRMTSDEFFSINTKKFDVIFIDGLHTYQQVRIDTINAMKCLKEGGWIAFHDMLPGNWKQQHVPRIQGSWNGDVWKIAFELLESEGVDFRIVKIDHGVGVIRLTKPNPVLRDKQAELAYAQFDYFYNNIGRLPITEWKDAQEWLTK
jgi:hypothetical protein